MVGVNSQLFGNPLAYARGRHEGFDYKLSWHEYSAMDLARKGFEAVCDPKNYMPRELHQFPFDGNEIVEVFVKDTTKIGGYEFLVPATDAIQKANDKAAWIVQAERGNAITEANISLDGVNFRLPAFGKNHIWFS
jgi:hypothetical protein